MASDETPLQPPGRSNPEPVDSEPDEFWLRTLIRWYIGLIIRPAPTIREIVERRPVLEGLGTLVFVTLVNILAQYVIGRAFRETDTDAEAIQTAVALFALTLIYLLAVFVFCLVAHCVSRRLGGVGSLAGLIAVVAMSSIVVAVWTASLPIQEVFVLIYDSTGVSGDRLPLVMRIALMAAVPLWILVLTAIAVRENYRLSYAATIVSIVLSLVGAIILGTILLIIFFVVFALVYAVYYILGLFMGWTDISDRGY